MSAIIPKYLAMIRKPTHDQTDTPEDHRITRHGEMAIG